MQYAPKLVEVSKSRYVMSDMILSVEVQIWTGGSWFVETKLRDPRNLTIRQFFHPDEKDGPASERAHSYAARIVRDCN